MRTRRAIFIGNSFTDGVPEVLATIAAANGDVLNHTKLPYSGKDVCHFTQMQSGMEALREQLQGHMESTQPVAVVIQGLHPSGHELLQGVDYASNRVWPCARRLHDEARQYGGQLFLRSTWAWYNQADGTSQRVEGAAALSAYLGGVPVSQEAVAFEYVRRNDPTLYGKVFRDGWHPSEEGKILIALVNYNLLFDWPVTRLRAQGRLVLPPIANVDANDAARFADLVGSAFTPGTIIGGGCLTCAENLGRLPPLPPSAPPPPLPPPSFDGLQLGPPVAAVVLGGVALSSCIFGMSLVVLVRCCCSARTRRRAQRSQHAMGDDDGKPPAARDVAVAVG